MTRARHRLSAAAVRNAITGTLYDGGGLQLEKSSKQQGKWVYRYSVAGIRRDMGLGAYPTVSLAEARAMRDRWEAKKASGSDPISVRDALQEEERQRLRAFDPLFEDAVSSCLQHNSSSLRNGGVAGRWRSPLDIHAMPILGKRRVSTLSTKDIKRVLEPGQPPLKWSNLIVSA